MDITGKFHISHNNYDFMYRTKPEKNLSIDGESIHEVPLLAEEFLNRGLLGESKSVSFKYVAPERFPIHYPVDSWYVQYRPSMYTHAHQQHLSVLSRLKK